MLSRLAISWTVFAALMGFALGGSLVWGTLQPPHAATHNVHAATKEKDAETAAKSKKEETDEALAYYTLWLMTFTGVLAFATVGLGVVTVGLYLTSEKQVALARKTLTDLERPYLFVFNVGRLSVESYFDLDAPENPDDFLMEITYSVANHGKIPAVITRIEAALDVSQDPRIPKMLTVSHPLLVSPILAAGEPRHELTENLTWDDCGRDEDGWYLPNLGEGLSLFFRIIIQYRGPFSTGHARLLAVQSEHRPHGPLGRRRSPIQ